jgi:hypothetical protein
VFVSAGPIAIGVDSILWQRFATGGRLRAPVTLRLPSLRRLEGARIAVDARSPSAPDAPLGIAVDGDPPSRVALVPGRRAWLAVPPRPVDGADVTLLPAGSAVVDGIVVAARPELARAAAAGLAVALLGLMLLRTRATAEAAGLGLFAAALVAIGAVPGWIALAWPGAPTVARLAVPFLVGAGGLALAFARTRERRDVGRIALLIAAGVFGCWVRAYLLPSAGSWDVDYWRTAMLQARAEGIARAYGGAEDIPEGHLRAQLRGEEPVSSRAILGRPIQVNYPPLAVVLWTASWRLADRWAVRLERIEAQALATKLASLAGDLCAVAVLLRLHRRWPWRAATLAALYWATPVSWLSSAAQGFQDGAYAPLVVIALALAACGHAFGAGAVLGVAAMIKLPALLAAPAVAGALFARTNVTLALRRLALAAAGGLLAIALAFWPFARAGTLAVAVVHVNSILLPGPVSGGSPNLWWLVGHAAETSGKGTSISDRVVFVNHRALPFPSFTVGRVLWAVSAVGTVLLQRRRPGLRPALLAAATLYFSYAMLATSVYENHVHPMFLLLLAGGLLTRRCRLVAAATAAIYVADILLMSGLGRFYTVRHLLLAPLTPAFEAARMAPGFDLTLLLAMANLTLLAVWWTGLPAALRTAEDGPDPTYRPSRAVA